MAMRALKLILAVSMASPLLAQTASDSIAAHAQAAQEAERRNDFPTAIREYDYLVHQLPGESAAQSGDDIEDSHSPKAVAAAIPLAGDTCCQRADDRTHQCA
jgi:hypothetical protein